MCTWVSAAAETPSQGDVHSPPTYTRDASGAVWCSLSEFWAQVIPAHVSPLSSSCMLLSAGGHMRLPPPISLSEPVGSQDPPGTCWVHLSIRYAATLWQKLDKCSEIGPTGRSLSHFLMLLLLFVPVSATTKIPLSVPPSGIASCILLVLLGLLILCCCVI